MKSKIINQLNQKDTELNSVIETILETETIIQMLESNYYQKSMENADIADVNINHLENIFTNETYYLAMKIVPLIERKVLYLSASGQAPERGGRPYQGDSVGAAVRERI